MHYYSYTIKILYIFPIPIKNEYTFKMHSSNVLLLYSTPSYVFLQIPYVQLYNYEISH